MEMSINGASCLQHFFRGLNGVPVVRPLLGGQPKMLLGIFEHLGVNGYGNDIRGVNYSLVTCDFANLDLVLCVNALLIRISLNQFAVCKWDMHTHTCTLRACVYVHIMCLYACSCHAMLTCNLHELSQAQAFVNELKTCSR